MKIRRKISESKIQRRIKALPTDDLVAAMDNTLSTIGQDVTAYVRGEVESLEQARMGGEAVIEMIDEIERRTTG